MATAAVVGTAVQAENPKRKTRALGSHIHHSSEGCSTNNLEVAAYWTWGTKVHGISCITVCFCSLVFWSMFFCYYRGGARGRWDRNLRVPPGFRFHLLRWWDCTWLYLLHPFTMYPPPCYECFVWTPHPTSRKLMEHDWSPSSKKATAMSGQCGWRVEECRGVEICQALEMDGFEDGFEHIS